MPVVINLNATALCFQERSGCKTARKWRFMRTERVYYCSKEFTEKIEIRRNERSGNEPSIVNVANVKHACTYHHETFSWELSSFLSRSPYMYTRYSISTHTVPLLSSFRLSRYDGGSYGGIVHVDYSRWTPNENVTDANLLEHYYSSAYHLWKIQVARNNCFSFSA